MMWVDPTIDAGLVALTDRRFDEWRDEALVQWPELSDAVVAERKCGRVMFQAGDRVRWETTGDDGLPLVRYGFVGGCNGDAARVVVMLDGELANDDGGRLQPARGGHRSPRSSCVSTAPTCSTTRRCGRAS